MYAARQHKEPTGRMFHQPEKKRTQLFRLEDNRGRKIAQETVKTLKTNVLQCVVKDDHDKKLAEKELLECLSIRILRFIILLNFINICNRQFHIRFFL